MSLDAVFATIPEILYNSEVHIEVLQAWVYCYLTRVFPRREISGDAQLQLDNGLALQNRKMLGLDKIAGLLAKKKTVVEVSPRHGTQCDYIYLVRLEGSSLYAWTLHCNSSRTPPKCILSC